ncbi:tautomerase family protein [Reinekea marinisedimentorum]|uniref:Tautomerase-like protein n=1 Tax=Reinekea marinisedimentorum TaxID=230495 RepID=A0A4R3I4B0_9GAMM|nr:tautomerase family protein [Reinekea marinisedimentorum]TCS38789.1 tautomerase-like protein [Reinekea marinisedimentorum]
MPLMQFDVIEGRSEAEMKAILDVTHEVMLEVFKVPERDRYQIVYEHKPANMIFQDTGLGFERTEKLIMLRVFSSPRTQEMKVEFMQKLADRLEAECGILGNDLMISFFLNTKNDWSFGFGEAQFYTGKL